MRERAMQNQLMQQSDLNETNRKKSVKWFCSIFSQILNTLSLIVSLSWYFPFTIHDCHFLFWLYQTNTFVCFYYFQWEVNMYEFLDLYALFFSERDFAWNIPSIMKPSYSVHVLPNIGGCGFELPICYEGVGAEVGAAPTPFGEM